MMVKLTLMKSFEHILVWIFPDYRLTRTSWPLSCRTWASTAVSSRRRAPSSSSTSPSSSSSASTRSCSSSPYTASGRASRSLSSPARAGSAGPPALTMGWVKKIQTIFDDSILLLSCKTMRRFGFKLSSCCYFFKLFSWLLWSIFKMCVGFSYESFEIFAILRIGKNVFTKKIGNFE